MLEKMDPEHSSNKLGIFKKVKKLLGKQQNNDDSLRDAIEELIEDDEENGVPISAEAEHERLLISNILELRDLQAVDIMVPRADISGVDINATKEELLEALVENPHSRIPVYDGSLDNISGVLYSKDILVSLAKNEPFKIKDLMVAPLVVSPAMRAMDLLIQLKRSKVHIAFVVDEFGGIDGLITINDLIETIVGEINEEHTLDSDPQLIERPDGSIIADARYFLDDFEEKYGELFSENEENEDVDTLAGLIINIAGHMPTRGEIIVHQASGVEFYIIDADPRKILRVRIRNIPKLNAERKDK